MKDSSPELRKLYIKLVCDGTYTRREAAAALGLTMVRISQLKRAYKDRGDAAFMHGNTGRVPANKKSDAYRKKIIDLYHSRYEGMNFQAFRFYLKIEHKISVSYKFIYRLMDGQGIRSPKARRKRGERLHLPRCRREAEGEMIQLDASIHDWTQSGKKFAIHGGIDDATGKIVGLFACENECFTGYCEVLRQTLTRYGKPVSLYTDRSGVFWINKKHDEKYLTIEEQLAGQDEKKTQFGKIAETLGIEMIAARSPQAKGRIERLWQTLQGQLPILFKGKGIKTISQINAFLSNFAAVFNGEYAIAPIAAKTLYRPAGSLNLEKLLSITIDRQTNAAGVFSWHGYRFTFDGKYRARKKIRLYVNELSVWVEYKGVRYNLVPLDNIDEWDVSDTMPQVVKNILNRYLFSDAKDRRYA